MEFSGMTLEEMQNELEKYKNPTPEFLKELEIDISPPGKPATPEEIEKFRNRGIAIFRQLINARILSGEPEKIKLNVPPEEFLFNYVKEIIKPDSEDPELCSDDCLYLRHVEEGDVCSLFPMDQFSWELNEPEEPQKERCKECKKMDER